MVPLPGLVSVAPPLGAAAAVPHIALVDPFTDRGELDEGVVAELAAYFADVVPFPVRLADLSQLPGGPAYLTPEPSAPFRNLAQGVVRLFPELRRPRGTLEVVPHLALGSVASLDWLHEQLDPWLPIATVAREAALWWWADDAVQTLATFPFGTSAA